MPKTIFKYVMTTVIAVVITLIVAEIRSMGIEDAQPILIVHIWCDAFFASGAIILCSGLLVFCNNNGVMDGMNYSLKRFFSAIFKAKIYDEDYESYKEQRRQKRLPFLHMVIVGGLFVLVSIVLLIVYYNT